MKSYFISLTQSAKTTGEEKELMKVRVNIAHIIRYYANEKGFTNIFITGVENWKVVHETPDQIDNLIYTEQTRL